MCASPAANRLHLRPVTPEDEDFLLALMASCKPELGDLSFSPDQVKKLVLRQFKAQQEEYRLTYPESGHSIVTLDNQPIGRLWTAQADDAVRVVDISFLPKHRRHGYGTQLYRQVIKTATALGKRVECTVFRWNQASLHFHRLFGFEETGGTKLTVSLAWHPPAER